MYKSTYLPGDIHCDAKKSVLPPREQKVMPMPIMTYVFENMKCNEKDVKTQKPKLIA